MCNRAAAPVLRGAATTTQKLIENHMPPAQEKLLQQQPSLFRVKLLYFSLYSSFGTVAPLFSLLYRSGSLSSEQIGLLAVIGPGKHIRCSQTHVDWLLLYDTYELRAKCNIFPWRNMLNGIIMHVGDSPPR
jgi:hypothetical protein